LNSFDLTDQSALNQILILAPYRRDADYLGRLLVEHDIEVRICSAGEVLADHLAVAPGVLVATHEALTPIAVSVVADHLSHQPSWSELPIVILLDRASKPELVRAELARSWPRSRLIFYQRPVTAVELVSGVQSALLARLRQREVRDHIAQEMELRRELNHRVKNILASVTSIFEMTRRGATSVEAFTDDFRGRLRALEKVHSAVFRAEERAVSIDDIALLTFEPYRLAGQERIVFDGPPVDLGRESGTTLALCLHELTTNAIKYGALSRPEGRVTLRWSVVEGAEPELALLWKESEGPIVHEPIKAGYGTRYVRSALAAMFGRLPTIAFEPDGLRCSAQGPLSRLSATDSPQSR
jgi:two-component sensor histidine kinase